jgi:hypothetical protein
MVRAVLSFLSLVALFLSGCHSILDLGPHQPAPVCTDSSPTSGMFTMPFDSKELIASTTKSYIVQANWSNQFADEAEDYSGLSFTVHNAKGASVNGSVDATGYLPPMGYPSIFIGQFGTYKNPTKGSNLPILASAITSIPTTYATNSDSIGHSSYNATYELWFTPSGAALDSGSAFDPGMGGAYLEIWMFKPTDRQPRGTDTGITRPIAGGLWEIWIDHDTQRLPTVSYVSTIPLSGIQFDLNAFIQDAIKNTNVGITSSMYLNVVFGGFGIWGGADGIELTQFCVHVN